METKIDAVYTVRRNAIVIFGDTTGFSNFARRTVDQPDIHREFLLGLYQRSSEYRIAFNCFMKKNCDGVMFVHEYPDRPTAKEVIRVLKGIEKYQKDCERLIYGVPYPRPDGYRCRVTMGVVWKMTITKEPPPDCKKNSCIILTEVDYWEYSTILAFRMLASHKKIPLACCQAIKEVGSEIEGIEFRKLSRERRIPDGIFKEDMQDLWAFKSDES